MKRKITLYFAICLMFIFNIKTTKEGYNDIIKNDVTSAKGDVSCRQHTLFLSTIVSLNKINWALYV